MRVVFDDEHREIPILNDFAVVGDYFVMGIRKDCITVIFAALENRSCITGGRSGVVQRQVKCKRAALSVHASQPDFAAQQRRQFAADREPQTSAAVFTGSAGVRLLERFKNQALLLRSDTEARVFHGE